MKLLIEYFIESNIVFKAIILAVLNYLILYLLYKRKIISLVDPLNISLLLLSFNIAGFFIFTENIKSNNFYILILLIYLYFVSGAIGKNPIKPKCAKIRSIEGFQLYFVYILLSLLVINLVFNCLLFNIPLLHEAGTYSRINLGDAPSAGLVSVSPFIASIVYKYYLLTSNKRVKIVALIAVLIGVINGFLGGSKGFTLTIILILTNYLFINKLKVINSTDVNEINLLNRKNKLIIKLTIVITFIILITLPAYLSQLKFSVEGINSFLMVVYRLFIGFDNFIYMVISNISIYGHSKINLLEIYLYPVYHKLISNPESFQTSGQYLMYLVTGSYNASHSGLNPNANLIMDLIFGINIYATFLLIPIISYMVFTARTKYITYESLNTTRLIVYDFLVFMPLGFFLDPAYMLTNMGLLFIIYLLTVIIYNIINLPRTRSLIITFH